MDMNTANDLSAQSIVIIGSKPNAALPMVRASVVLTANSAVEIGLEYRKKYNSRIIAFVTGSALNVPRRETYDVVGQALTQSRPDEVIIIGKSKDTDDPVSFVKNDLGLTEATVSFLGHHERIRLMSDALGWRKILVMAHISKSRGITNLRCAIPDLLGPRNMPWLFCSTGLSAIFYGMRRFSNAREIIATGIGLEGGTHFNGVGEFTGKSAKGERITVKYWPHKRRLSLFTTDDSMSRIGNIPKWQGEVFYFNSGEKEISIAQ